MIRFVLILMASVILSSFAAAHELEMSVKAAGPARIVFAEYNDTPAKSVDVTVTAPGAKSPFQKGQTDLHGNFAFIPDSAGQWSVTIDDRAGHRLTQTVAVEDGDPQLNQAQPSGNAGFRGLPMIFIGLGLIAVISIGGLWMTRLGADKRH